MTPSSCYGTMSEKFSFPFKENEQRIISLKRKRRPTVIVYQRKSTGLNFLLKNSNAKNIKIQLFFIDNQLGYL